MRRGSLVKLLEEPIDGKTQLYEPKTKSYVKVENGRYGIVLDMIPFEKNKKLKNYSILVGRKIVLADQNNFIEIK